MAVQKTSASHACFVYSKERWITALIETRHQQAGGSSFITFSEECYGPALTSVSVLPKQTAPTIIVRVPEDLMKSRRLMFVVLVIAAIGAFTASCGKVNQLTGSEYADDLYPSMGWYTAHTDEVSTVSLEQMADIVNRAYAAHPDSAIGPVRQFIWNELKATPPKSKTVNEPMSVDSYSFYGLTKQEQLLLLGEPWYAKRTYESRDAAVNETSRQWPNYPQYQDKADGFRHAYWNILMCNRINEDWARKFSTAHEYGAVNGLLDSQMDLNNNGIGRALWRVYATSRSESQYSSIVKGWQYVKVTSFTNAVPYIIYLAGV